MSTYVSIVKFRWGGGGVRLHVLRRQGLIRRMTIDAINNTGTCDTTTFKFLRVPHVDPIFSNDSLERRSLWIAKTLHVVEFKES